MNEEALKKLREPFPANQISKLPKPKSKDAPKGRCNECGGWHGLPAVHLDYVGHAALTDRLLDADPAWAWEPMAMSPDGLPVMDPFGGMWIKLTVAGVTRLGYGHAGEKSGGDAIKEIIGDALRNAAMRFGAALDLWHKGDLHAHEEPSAEEPQHPPIETMSENRVTDWITVIKEQANAESVKVKLEQAKQACTNMGDSAAYKRIVAAAKARAAQLQGEHA